MGKTLWQSIQEVRPILEAMLVTERVPPDLAEELLSEVIQQLCFKHPAIQDPGGWLVHALQRALERSSSERSTDRTWTSGTPIS